MVATSLFVDEEFRSLIPPLEANELGLLEESILEEGVRDAIVTWNGYIVDGHNRYNIITKHGLKDYRVLEKKFADREEVKIWIMKNQLGRRNLALYLCGEYRLTIKAWEDTKNQAKENQLAGLKQNQDTVCQNSNKRIDTKKVLADQVGVSTDTASRIIKIKEKAPEFIKAKCRTDEMSINEGYKSTRLLETLPEEDRGTIISMVETGAAKNIVTARKLLRREKAKGIIPPVGKYQVIYADPPWEYEFGLDIHGAAERHYNSLSIEELCQLSIADISDDNAVLFLWVTSPKLRDCFAVIEAWGFEYKTSFVWDKVKHVMGHYNSVRHEFLLLATRGSYPKQANTLHDSVLTIERSKTHSQKPDEFRELIDEMYPVAKKIELFARFPVPSTGWKYWGDEV